MDSEDNPVKLKAENRKLHKELRGLVVEKNLMEHKLYRAFHKLLQTKKRKIRELGREIKKLKGEDVDGVIDDDQEQSHHCQTCRCGSKSRKKRVIDDDKEEVNGQEAENGGGDDDSESSDTQDPFAADYSDETDVDDKPASKSNSKTTSPSKTVVVSCHEPSGGDSMEVASTSEASSKPKVTKGSSGGTVVPDPTTPLLLSKNDKELQEPEVLPTSENSSSQDLDLLVDEICA